MQKYRTKTPLASLSDHLLRALVPWVLGVGWFVYLWGVSLPSMAAGSALGVMLWLCLRLLGKKRVARREQQMRRMIGGELALERLLLQPPRHAAFQAALWLTPEAPVVMERSLETGVTGTLDGKPVLVRLICQHESQPISVQQVIEALRDAGREGAQECLLCATAPLTREAAAYCEGSELPLRLFDRSAMIRLAGLASPATDQDLAQLGRRRRSRRAAREWLEQVVSPEKAKRYFWYGMGLSALALLTGLSYYPIPATLCFGLYLACRLTPVWRRRRHC